MILSNTSYMKLYIKDSSTFESLKPTIRSFSSSLILRGNEEEEEEVKDLRKQIFFQNKIKVPRPTLGEEIIRRWVIKTEETRDLRKEIEKIDKANSGLDAVTSGEKLIGSDGKAYYDLRTKYKDIFNSNNSELENPTATDVLEMDKVTLNEIKEMTEESLRIETAKHFQKVKNLVDMTLKRKRSTPTNDFIDELPQDHNPLDDIGDD
jgi:hypothetical protein